MGMHAHSFCYLVAKFSLNFWTTVSKFKMTTREVLKPMWNSSDSYLKSYSFMIARCQHQILKDKRGNEVID